MTPEKVIEVLEVGREPKPPQAPGEDPASGTGR